jgi:hypothetical protein
MEDLLNSYIDCLDDRYISEQEQNLHKSIRNVLFSQYPILNYNDVRLTNNGLLSDITIKKDKYEWTYELNKLNKINISNDGFLIGIVLPYQDFSNSHMFIIWVNNDEKKVNIVIPGQNYWKKILLTMCNNIWSDDWEFNFEVVRFNDTRCVFWCLKYIEQRKCGYNHDESMKYMYDQGINGLKSLLKSSLK